MSEEKPTILIVDDEAAILSALRRIVARSSCRPIEAPSTAEALGLLDDGEEPAAAICDYNMPGSTGLDLARELRHRHPGLPVLLLSGGTPNDEIREAIDSGLVWAYAAKPWSLSWMRSAISAMVNREPPPELDA